MADGRRFEVAGAGELIVEAEEGDVQRTGSAWRGIGIACTWDSSEGRTGGVLDEKNVKELVDYLQKWLDSDKPV